MKKNKNIEKENIIKNLKNEFHKIVCQKMRVGLSVVHYPEKIRYKFIKKHFMYQEPAIHGFCPLIEDMEQKTMEIVIPLSQLR